MLAAAVVVAVIGLVLLYQRNPAGGTKVTEPLAGITGATKPPFESGTFATLAADRGILVHCGNSMRPATEVIAAEFQRRTGIAVHLSFGGSAELLSIIDLGREGDLYICHDPYAEILRGKELLAEAATVGALIPIIVVPPENPLGIQSYRELLVPGRRVAMPDARFATAGRLVREALQTLDQEAALEANLVMEGRGHNEVALAVLNGQADAGIVWRFIAHFYWGRLKRLDLGLHIPPTRVTLCQLTTAKDVAAARQFMELALDDFGRRVFVYHGYAQKEEQ